ncbi:uncharacterized protein LOC144097947 [Amblyomma americanum]
MLRALIKPQVEFEWTENHAKEWKCITQALATSPLLAIFDPKKKTKITCDASKDGVGAALLQCHGGDWRPVAYASRVLTPPEQRYAQIEKETLGILFGCEKFHQFVYGQTVIIETDHKPLLSIAAKGICDMPPRLQRFFLRLLRYDYVLQYVPGKHLVLADMLSRSTTPGGVDNAGATEDVEVHALQLLNGMVTVTTQQKLAKETARDCYLQTVVSNLSAGNPIQDVERLPDTSARSVVAALSAMFARYGIPIELCTDNGPQFSSQEFAAFAKEYDFAHVTSSPHYPQSNGLAEKGVQIVKRIMKKTQDARHDFWLGLLAYRSTPLIDGQSPGELLQGRRLRSNLPDFGGIKTIEVKKHRQTPKGQPLPQLGKGDVVRLRDTTWSQKGKVVGEAAPRSYHVVTESRRVLRRNRRHLLHSSEQYAETSDDDTDDDCADEADPNARNSPGSVTPQPYGTTRRKAGRRPVILASVVASAACSVSAYFVESLLFFALCRFVLGSCLAVTFVTSSVLLFEIVGGEYRAAYVMLSQFGFSFGLLFVAVMDQHQLSWRAVQLCCSLPVIACAIAFLVAKESPRWLVARGMFEEAEVVMMHAGRVNGISRYRSTALWRNARNEIEEADLDYKVLMVLGLWTSAVSHAVLPLQNVELFPQLVRTFGFCWGEASALLGALCSPYAAMEALVSGPWAALVLIGGLEVISACLTATLPETRWLVPFTRKKRPSLFE